MALPRQQLSQHTVRSAVFSAVDHAWCVCVRLALDGCLPTSVPCRTIACRTTSRSAEDKTQVLSWSLRCEAGTAGPVQTLPVRYAFSLGNRKRGASSA